MILFDLDGTLVDTAPDLGLALNLQRERHGFAPLPQESIRPFASHGSKGLLSVGFGLTPADSAFAAMRQEYLDIYDQVFTSSPVLFDGTEELLAAIEGRELHWGIVTNKPRRFSQPLLQVMGLEERIACLVCGDDAARAKPHPDTLLKACEMTGIMPTSCMYVGDAERDIQAGKAAGMRTVVALYGYLDEADTPAEWGADATISSPLELLSLI